MAVTFSGGGYAGVVINLIQPPPSVYVWGWGYNTAGPLGIGDTTDRSSPTQVGALTNWANIAIGLKHEGYIPIIVTENNLTGASNWIAQDLESFNIPVISVAGVNQYPLSPDIMLSP
jgi:hypothetical protein